MRVLGGRMTLGEAAAPIAILALGALVFSSVYLAPHASGPEQAEPGPLVIASEDLDRSELEAAAAYWNEGAGSGLAEKRVEVGQPGEAPVTVVLVDEVGSCGGAYGSLGCYEAEFRDEPPAGLGPEDTVLEATVRIERGPEAAATLKHEVGNLLGIPNDELPPELR
jgi:hypothetical protein